MRVLVTGHLGYVGSVLTGLLRHSGFDVYGWDAGFFSNGAFGRMPNEVTAFGAGPDFDPADLASFDAVVHLAWLPLVGNSQDARLQHQCEELAASLAQIAKQAWVPHFVFVSSWEIHRSGLERCLGESTRSTTASVLIDALRSAERRILELADTSFTPTVVRPGECYGVSPRLRLDLSVNAWTASAISTGVVSVQGDGSAWRPFLHVEDLARALRAILVAPEQSAGGRVFEVVAPDQNIRLCDAADQVAENTGAVRRLAAIDGAATASVKLDVCDFLAAFPRFNFRWTLPRGVGQLREAMTHAGIAPSDLRGDRYHRARRLRELLETGQLSPEQELVTAAPALHAVG